jgi:hypothetical protein
MATKKSSAVAEAKANTEKPIGRSAEWAKRGVSNLMESAQFTMAVALDVVSGAMQPQHAQAISTNVGKTLKATEMQLKYGGTGKAPLKLIGAS